MSGYASSEREGFIARAGVDNSRWYGSALISLLAVGEQTNRTFTVLEGRARQGEDVPRHTHTHEDESFYLLEGQMTFQIGAQTVRAGEGDFVYLPRQVGHAWTSDTDARFIVFISPAGFETSFIEFSEPATEVTLPPSAEGPPAEAFLQALMARENELGVFYDFQQPERE